MLGNRGFRIEIWAAFAALGLAALTALAQDYPSKPIRWVVPFAPGGSGDALARVMGPRLSDNVGQPVVIENRPGGNTTIAAVAVIKAPSDGHTLLQAVDSTVTLPVLYKDLPYRIESDLVPIGIMVEQARLLSSNPQKIAAKSLQELISYAKASPGKVNLGVGTGLGQLTAELLKSVTGIDVVIVPFKGGNQSSIALLGGTIDLALGEITSNLPNIKSGRIRALATTRNQRATSLPDVPTLAESGYQFNARSWFGLLGPGGTPRAIVMRLNQDINRILGMPEVRDRLTSLGMEPVTGTPEHFADLIKADTSQWSKLMKETGIRLE